jgi:hypothetical protein
MVKGLYLVIRHYGLPLSITPFGMAYWFSISFMTDGLKKIPAQK